MKDIPNSASLDEVLALGRRRTGVYVSGHGAETVYARPAPLPAETVENNRRCDAAWARWLQRQIARTDLSAKRLRRLTRLLTEAGAA